LVASFLTRKSKNIAPVDMVNISLFTGFLYIPGGAGFLPSTVSINVPLFFFCGGERNEEEVNPAKFQCLNLKL